MGLAASQARYMMLYARKSDLEYNCQTINQRRLLISSQTDQVAQTYANAMSAQILKIQMNGQEYDLTQPNLSLVNLEAYYGSDNTAVPSNMSSTDLQQGLRDGAIYFKYIVTPPNANPPNGVVDWTTNPNIEDRLYTEQQATAEAAYDYQTAVLQGQDRQLEMQEHNYETQQSAVQTEIDAVKKVIDKNIEKSFKTLG